MKTIIYNDDYLDKKDINKEVKRAKAIIINSKDELLMASTNNDYYLVGGHVEDNESDEVCLHREILEETGIDLEIKDIRPYFVVEYLCKDYPDVGDNTNYIANYYVVKCDEVPNLDNVELTEGEKEGGFSLKYIHKDEVMNVLEESLNICTKKNVVRDTIDAVSEYLRQN
ncbi:MAG: NUDIX hydrolase [Bacilli bacterium]|nr:NUDIX hydrolase [Bacilli bacterium]